MSFLVSHRTVSENSAPSQIEPRRRLRKAERHQQILLELKLRPHVRNAELAARMGVSSETIRRDVAHLSRSGRIDREHGGVSAPRQGHYPSYGERGKSGTEQRERIGRAAADLVQSGQTLMIDSGSTTYQMARFLAYRGVCCTVVTNSLEIATTLGAADEISVIMCPGDFLPSEVAVVGADTLEFLRRHRVDACFIGASAISSEGVFETVRGFAAVKRAMLAQSGESHLLIHADKFDRTGLRVISGLEGVDRIVTDRSPTGRLGADLQSARTEVIVARSNDNVTKFMKPGGRT